VALLLTDYAGELEMYVKSTKSAALKDVYTRKAKRVRAYARLFSALWGSAADPEHPFSAEIQAARVELRT
jgi:hypothetical protein